MQTAITSATTRTSKPNIWAGPCRACGVHVGRKLGVVVPAGDAWSLYCSAHGGRTGDAPANDASGSSAPPSSDAPAVSVDACRAALALLRHAVTDRRAPAGAVDALVEISTLCVWRNGTPDLARELYAVLPNKIEPEATDERAADIIGDILDRNGTRMIDRRADRIDPDDRAREESYVPVNNTDALAAADALVGPPVNSPTSRAYKTVTITPPATKPARKRGGNPFGHRAKP